MPPTQSIELDESETLILYHAAVANKNEQMRKCRERIQGVWVSVDNLIASAERCVRDLTVAKDLETRADAMVRGFNKKES